MSIPQDSLLTRLGRADVVCKECGLRYGKYSVGCSSTWVGICGVCGEEKPITEVRDYGYLAKGIHEEKAKIAEQSKVVAKYMATQAEGEPQPTYDELLKERDELKQRLQKLLNERG